MWRGEGWPEGWKEGVVVPVVKKRGRDDGEGIQRSDFDANGV